MNQRVEAFCLYFAGYVEMIEQQKLNQLQGGKTICGLYLISMMKHKTLVIVHKEFLMNQWRDRIAQFLPSARVGFIQQTKVDVSNKDIVIAMLQSLSMRDYDDKVLKDFKHVIFDECHHIGARVFSQAMYRISNAKFILGLSATPKRRDGLTFVLQWFLGDVVYLAERANTENEMEVKAKVLLVRQKTSPSSSEGGGEQEWENEEDEENEEDNENEEGEEGAVHRDKRRKKVNKSPKGGSGGGGGMLTDLVTTVAQREGRNRVIAEQIVACCSEGRKILVLSDRIKHLRLIDRQLSSLAAERGQDRVDSGFYIGGMSFEELLSSSKKSVLLGSYPMSSEGLDIPSLDTILLATPRASVEQSVGRIMRHGATSDRKPLIIDVVDEDESPFRRSAKKRIRFYRKSGYKVTTLSFAYTPGDEDIECQEDAEGNKSKKKKNKKTATDWKNLNKECPEEAKSEGALFAKRFQFKTMTPRLLGGKGQTEEVNNSNEATTTFTLFSRRTGLTSPPKTTTTTTTSKPTSPQKQHPQQNMKALSPVKGKNASTSPYQEVSSHKRKLEELSPSKPTLSPNFSTSTPTSPQKQPHAKPVSPIKEPVSHKRKLEDTNPPAQKGPVNKKPTTAHTIPKPTPTSTTTASTSPKKTSPLQQLKKGNTSPSNQVVQKRNTNITAPAAAQTKRSSPTQPKKQAAPPQATKRSPTASPSLLQCPKCGKPYSSYFPHSCG